MPGKIQFRPDRQSGPLLASTVIVFLGAIAAATVTTASGQNPLFGLLLFVSLAAAFPILLLLLQSTPRQAFSALTQWVRSRKSIPKTEYQPKSLKTLRATRTYGTNRPPSAAELKELKGGTNHWVPSSHPASSPAHRPSDPGAAGS